MMTDPEAEMAIKAHALVGTHDVQGKGIFCLFSTGYLIKKIKAKGKKIFLFRDKWGEIEVSRPASAFNFIR